MKFGQGTESHIVARLEPTTTCLCIWSFKLFLPNLRGELTGQVHEEGLGRLIKEMLEQLGGFL